MSGNLVPDEITHLRFALWDSGDSSYDPVVLLDNFQ